MTEPQDLPPRDAEDALAAEYVLGVLSLGERATAADRMRRDSRFAARVALWQERLAPLDAETPEVAPSPELLARIESRLFPARRRAPRWRFVLGMAGGVLAAAAVAVLLLVVLQMRPGPEAPELRATLRAELVAEDTTLAFAALWREDGLLQVRRVSGEDAGTGQDYELWLIGADGEPASLGLLRGVAAQTTVDGLGAGMTLAISLEPEGGSTTGAPTGPVLAAAPLTAI